MAWASTRCVSARQKHCAPWRRSTGAPSHGRRQRSRLTGVDTGHRAAVEAQMRRRSKRGHVFTRGDGDPHVRDDARSREVCEHRSLPGSGRLLSSLLFRSALLLDERKASKSRSCVRAHRVERGGYLRRRRVGCEQQRESAKRRQWTGETRHVHRLRKGIVMPRK